MCGRIGSTGLVLCVALVLPALAPARSEAGGGGSNAVFSLDRTSPGLVPGFTGGDLFVDDPGTGAGGTLMLALPFTGLALTPAHNVDALASGQENGVPAILGSVGLEPNPLDLDVVRYQYSVERLAVDGVTGFVAVPFVAPVFIAARADFEPQFLEDHQAADIFDNVASADRFNFPMVFEEQLELTGLTLPPEDIDDIDAFTSLGSLGVADLDEDGDGFPDAPVYFSVDGGTEGAGIERGTIFVKPPGPGPRLVYATQADLGLAPFDDVDALSIWEASYPPDYTFGPGDGIVFSLAAGSPTLDVLMDGVTIDEGGIFLALPGAGIVAALPGGYFSLSPDDDLDGLHVVDPRSGFPGPCFGMPAPTGVAPFGSLMLVQNTVTLMPGGELEIDIYLSETERMPDAGLLTDFTVTATISDGVARFTSGSTPHAGPPFPPGCQGGCADGHPRFPPCAGLSATFLACDLPGAAGPNLCLGNVHLEPIANGSALITVTATGTGAMGPIEIGSAYATVTVAGVTSAVGGASPIASGPVASPNPFRSSVRIDLGAGAGEGARITITDVAGRAVRTMSGLPRGARFAAWDGRDETGREVAPGLYVVRVETEASVRTVKVVRR